MDSQKYAINLVEQIVKENNINCDFDKVKSYLFEDKKINKICDEIKLLKEFGINLNNTNILPNNKIVNKGCFVSDTS